MEHTAASLPGRRDEAGLPEALGAAAQAQPGWRTRRVLLARYSILLTPSISGKETASGRWAEYLLELASWGTRGTGMDVPSVSDPNRDLVATYGGETIQRVR